MALLDYRLINALSFVDDDQSHGVPNLERAVAESPMLFAQVLALGSKRTDGKQDPTGWSIAGADRKGSPLGQGKGADPVKPSARSWSASQPGSERGLHASHDACR